MTTKRYYAPDFKAAAEGLKRFVSDRADAPDEEKLQKDYAITTWREKYRKKLADLEEKGEIVPENSDRFMTDDFDIIVQRYLKNMSSRGLAERELEQRYETFVKVHGKKLPLFEARGSRHGF
jgi:hypothetical protein